MRLKYRILWGAAFLGPGALLIADRIAHLFGVCLGY